MGQAVMQPVDARAISAARYWASRPGNFTIASVFDEEDAQQEAALALLKHPGATWSILYRRVLDAVNGFVPGYRDREMPSMVPLDEWTLPRVQCAAEQTALFHECLSMFDRLPEWKRAPIVSWLMGEEDQEAAARHGVTKDAWCMRRSKVLRELKRRNRHASN